MRTILASAPRAMFLGLSLSTLGYGLTQAASLGASVAQFGCVVSGALGCGLWLMNRSLDKDLAELNAIMDASDPEKLNPYRNMPGYEDIKPSEVIKKRWDTMTGRDRDVDFWMRTHALQDRLAMYGDTKALQNLRQRYEETRQEEHDLQFRTSPKRSDGMDEYVFPKEITVDVIDCDWARRVLLVVKNSEMMLTPEIALELAQKLALAHKTLAAEDFEDKAKNDALRERRAGS